MTGWILFLILSFYIIITKYLKIDNSKPDTGIRGGYSGNLYVDKKVFFNRKDVKKNLKNIKQLTEGTEKLNFKKNPPHYKTTPPPPPPKVKNKKYKIKQNHDNLLKIIENNNGGEFTIEINGKTIKCKMLG